jgi:SAM-dependent methyltransferase
MDSCEDRGWHDWLLGARGPGRWGASLPAEDITRRILDGALLRRGDTVVDLGAGTGELSLPAARSVGPGGKVIAVDSSQACLEALGAAARAAGLENVTLLKGLLEDLPLDDSSCDAALCRSALIYSTDLAGAVGQIARVLSPGGRFSVFEPLPGESGWRTGGALGAAEGDFAALERTLRERRASYCPDRAALRGAFESAGFEDILSLPVRFQVDMAGMDPEVILRDYLQDLPGDLAASKVLKGVFAEDLITATARAFSRAAAAGKVTGWVWCLYVRGTRPA